MFCSTFFTTIIVCGVAQIQLLQPNNTTQFTAPKWDPLKHNTSHSQQVGKVQQLKLSETITFDLAPCAFCRCQWECCVGCNKIGCRATRSEHIVCLPSLKTELNDNYRNYIVPPHKMINYWKVCPSKNFWLF